MITTLHRRLRGRPLLTDAVLAGIVLVLATTVRPDTPGRPDIRLETIIAGALASALLVFRRRHPVVVWATSLVLCLGSIIASQTVSPVIIPLFVALYSAAAWRDRRTAVVTAVVTAASLSAVVWSIPYDNDGPPPVYVLVAWCGMATALGVAIQSRRLVVDAAIERAARAEQTREEEAQRRVAAERLRIARELHDVVAHHISVINVQSGVARHLLDTDPDQARVALGHIRSASEVVLAEMSTLLGLLRSPDDGNCHLDTTEPTPGLAQVPQLVDSTRLAGLDVTLRVSGAAADLPPSTDLAAYRLIQESLTNARKHGQGYADVTVAHSPDWVSIVVTNPAGSPAADQAGERVGHGLIGMRERVAAAGGEFHAGPESGGFQVSARLPTRQTASA